MENRIIIYFKKPKIADKWFFYDHKIRFLFDLIFRRTRMGSLEKVFKNLCAGFDRLKISYLKNIPFEQIKPTDRIIVLGTGKEVLEGYKKSNKIIAGIGLMTHPTDWPTLFQDYPIATYLQHSVWAAKIYTNFFGPHSCKIWPVGIDTDFWKPQPIKKRPYILIYEKFLWDKDRNKEEILNPILTALKNRQIDYRLISYGSYSIKAYKQLLTQCYGMIFLCEHESQGLAYQEAMAMNTPIFAWNQGFWLDKNLQKWGEKEPVAASSVPYFEESCGDQFKDLTTFNLKFDDFNKKAKSGNYEPRNYVLAHLTLEKSAERMLEIIKEVYT